jgi:hypothetical protein
MSVDMTSETTTSPRGNGRRVLAGVALVLACLVILFTTVAVWAHQVAFNTDRFTALTEGVVANPALIDPLSAKVSAQVVEALDVQTRIADKLPGPTKALAPVLTQSIQDAIDKRLHIALARPGVQAALVKALSFTHAGVMNLLRGKPDAVSVVDGYIVIEVFPVVGAALDELQASGLIPSGIQLPDLSSPDQPGILRQRLATALGVSLPADFGTIQLMPADNLLTARSIVQASDVIVVALIILSVILVALALWLARDRRRMLVYLGVGTIVAFLLGRLAIRGFENALVGGITDADVATSVRIVVDATIEDLRRVTSAVLIVTAIVAIAAYLWGRPAWAVAATSRVRGTTPTAGATGSASRSAGGSPSPGRRPMFEGLGQALRDHPGSVERIGIAVIAFVVIWLAFGLELAVLAAALVVGLEFALRALSDSPDDA